MATKSIAGKSCYGNKILNNFTERALKTYRSTLRGPVGAHGPRINMREPGDCFVPLFAALACHRLDQLSRSYPWEHAPPEREKKEKANVKYYIRIGKIGQLHFRNLQTFP